MRGTKEMLGLIGWLKAAAYAGSKNTNKPRNKQTAYIAKQSKRRNWKVK